MQLDVALVARQPDLGEARHLPGRADEARVAAPAVAAVREHDARAGVREIGDQVALVREHLCPDRDAQLGVGAVGAVLARAAAVATRSALIRFRRCSAERSRSDGSASSTTSPPSPPSPPSGPPFGTYFSRRNDRPPSPPCPACTCNSARSLNIVGEP